MSDFKTDLTEILKDEIHTWHGLTLDDVQDITDRVMGAYKRHSVPDEPTEDMVRAGTGWREYDTDYYMGSNERNMVYRIYKSMIAAAKEESN